MKKLPILLLIVFFLLACKENHNDLFTNNIIQISAIEQEEKLTGEPLINSEYEYGNSKIFNVDNYIILRVH